MMYLGCPHCSSFFEVKDEDLGKQGRKVRCSVCHKTWRAQRRDLSKTLPKNDEGQEPTLAAPPHAAQPEWQPAPLRASASSPASDLHSPSIPPPHDNIHPPHDNIHPPHDNISPPTQHGVANRLKALTQHNHHAFAPLQFAEHSIEQPINRLLRFAFSWVILALFLFAVVYIVRTQPLKILQHFPNAVHFYERLHLKSPVFAKLLLDGQNYSLTQATVASEYRLARDLLLLRVLVGNRTEETKLAPILRGTFRDARGAETSYFHFLPKESMLPAKGALEYRVQVDLPPPTSKTLTLTLLSMFEGKLDLGRNRLKVYNTNPPSESFTTFSGAPANDEPSP